jgi:hypothetical protein
VASFGKPDRLQRRPRNGFAPFSLLSPATRGGGLDARITITASYTGEYAIYVTTYAKGERGSYTLLVRP